MMPGSGAGKVAKFMTDESPTKAVTSMFLKSGPWAVMTLVLVLGIGYEAHRLVGWAGSSVTTYVTQSTQNNEILVASVSKMNDAVTEAESAHKDMLVSLTSLNDAIELRHKEHEDQDKKIDALIEKVNAACEAAPKERKELLDALNDIKEAIQALKLSP